MDRYFAHAARRQLASLDASLAIGRACLASCQHLTRLHLAVAGAATDDVALASLRVTTAPDTAAAVDELADGLLIQSERVALYCFTLREINRRICLGVLDAFAPDDGRG
jgi:hypothetical protein